MKSAQFQANNLNVSIGQAAKLLDVSIQTLRRWEKKGLLTPIRSSGGTRYYNLEELRRLKENSLGEKLTAYQLPTIVDQDKPLELASLHPDTTYIPSGLQGYIKPVRDLAQLQPAQPLDTPKLSPPPKQLLLPKALQNTLLATMAGFLVITSALVTSYLINPSLTKSLMASNTKSKDTLQTISSKALAPFNNLALLSLQQLSPKTYAQVAPVVPAHLALNPDNVLAATTNPGLLQINTNTEINGDLTVNGTLVGLVKTINAGANVSVDNTDPSNPTLSVNLPANIVSTLGTTTSKISGDILLGSGLSLNSSTKTISVSSNLSDIRANGGCSGCLTDSDVADNLTISSGGSVDVGALSGTVPISKGGTGLTSVTAGDLLYASAANTLKSLAIGSNGQVLNVSGGLPVWSSSLNLPGTLQLQSSSTMYSGTGVPANTIGSNGDYYFRTDGTTGNTSVYFKTGGSWISAGGGSLQNAYTVGNTITTTSGSDIAFTLASGLTTPTSFTLTNNGTNDAFSITNNETATNGILVKQNTAAKTLTNAINITQSAGNITNGLNFTGTFTNLINSTNWSLSNGGTITTNGGYTQSGSTTNTFTGATTANSFSSSGATITGGTINSTSVGATTPSTAAFTTLTSSGASTLGTGASLTNTFGSGASSTNTIGSTTTPGTLTLHGATTLDNTFTVSGSNLTSLGGNLTVSGTAWTATPTISGLITATSGLTSNGTLTVGGNQNLTLNSGTGVYSQTFSGTTQTPFSLTSTFSPTAGGTQNNINTSVANTAATSANTLRGLNLSLTDNSSALANTDIGINVDVSAGTNTSATRYAAIFNGGNVGIGTTGPSYKTEIDDTTSGFVSILDITNSSAKTWASNSATGNAIRFDSRYTGQISNWATANINWGYTDTYANSGATLAFDVINSGGTFANVMTLKGSGNVGIGTTGPSAKLEVNGGVLVDGGASVASVNAGELYWSGNVFQIESRASSGYASNRYEANQHIFNIAGTEYMRLTTSGGLHIGSTFADPGANNLRVQGTTTLDNTLTVSAGGETITAGGLGEGTGAPTESGIKIGGSTTTGVSQYGLYANNTSSNNATTNISEIYSKVQTAAASYTVPDVYGLEIDTPTKGAGSTITNDWGIRIRPQNVGTGSTNYGVYIDTVANATNNYGLRITGTAATSGNYAIYSDAAAQSYFAGNVGIGTTSPGAKLDVSGTINLTGGLINTATNILDQGSSGVAASQPIRWILNESGYGLGLNNTSTAGDAQGALIKIAGTGTQKLFTLNSGGTDRVTVLGNGNVGIGTTNPSYPLVAEKDSISTTPTTSTQLQNATAATSGTPNQYSPSLQFTGQSWNTGSVASNQFDAREYLSVSSANPPTAKLNWGFQRAGGGYTDYMNLDNSGNLTLTGNLIANGGSAGFWSRSGTTITPATAGDLLSLPENSTDTTGNLFNISYASPATLTGALVGVNVDLNNGQVTNSNNNVTGVNVKLPTVTDSNTTGTVNIKGLSFGFGTGAGINQTGAGATVYTGVDVSVPAITQTSGTITGNGVNITTSSQLTGSATSNGLNISASGVGAGSLNAVNISGITGSTGTETALNIGSGWDNVLSVGGTSILNGSGVVQVAAGGTNLTSYTAGDLIYASGTTTLAKLAGGSANNGKVLTVSSGLPTWGTIAGSSCTDCVVNDPTAAATNTITPSTNIVGLTVRQTTAVTPTADIFDVTNKDGTSKYFYVDSSGNVSTGGVASQTLTLTPASDTTALTLVGTNVSTQALEYINSKNASAANGIVNLAYGVAQTLTGAVTGVREDLSTNVTATNQNVTGYSVTLPTMTNTVTAGTVAYKGLSVVAGGGITQNGTGGTTTFTGVDVTLPTLTQSLGTVTGNGINISTPATPLITGGTVNGLNVAATGVSVGSLNGVNISGITAGAGAETAVNIGTGWDYGIYSATTGTNYFAGNVGIGTTNPGANLDLSASYTSATSGNKYADRIAVTNTGATSTGTDNTYGLNITSTRSGATGGTTNNYGAYITTSNSSVSNAYGLYLDSIASATNNYGLYINSVAASSSNYAIYSNAAAQSYFAGNVGIGTTGPGAALDIQNATSPQLLVGASGAKLTAGYGTVFGSNHYFLQTSGATASIALNAPSGQQIRLGTNNNIVVGVGDNGLSVGSSYATTAAPSNGAIIQGNVGIGTTSPQQALTLTSGDNLAVNLATPSAPTVTPTGTAGTTSYTYTVTALDGAGGETVASTGTTTTTGNATLNGTNYNAISWTAVTGAASYNVYRTASGGTPSTTGKIGNSTTTSLNDTGLAASGTSPTSTTAYVNKLTASGNSWLLGGNVGIGTASPIGLLDFQGTGAYIGKTYSNTINFASATNGAAEGWINYSGYNEGATQFRDLKIGNGKQPATPIAMFQGSTGNVGIGTAAPRAVLETVGRVFSTSVNSPANPSGGAGVSMIYRGDAGYNQGIGGYLFSYDYTGSAYKPLTLDVGNLNFSIAGTTKMVVDTSGNVGIGTASPGAVGNGGTYTLTQIYNSGGYGALSLGSGTTLANGVTNGAIDFYDSNYSGSNKRVAVITGSADSAGTTNPSGYLSFFTSDGAGNTSERIRITSAGNVGIGTTSPGALLEVNKSGIAATATTGTILDNNTASTSLATQQYSPSLQFTGHAWNTTAVAADNQLDAREYLSVTSGTTPTSTLNWGFQRAGGGYSDVLSLSSAGTLNFAASSGNFISSTNANFTVASGGGIDAVSETLHSSGTALTLTSGNILLSNGSNYGAKDNGGTARAMLYMAGDISGAAGNNVNLGNPTANSLTFFTGGQTVGTNERMTITSGGNVGIGTTSPSGLDAGGTFTLTNIHSASGYGDLSLSTGATADGSAAGVVQFGTTGASTKKETAAILSSLVGSGATNAAGNLAFYTNPGTAGVTERMRIDQNGNVGIGTTSPGATLQVVTTSAPTVNDGANAFRLGYAGGNTNGSLGAGLIFTQRYDVSDLSQIRVGGIYGYKTAATGSFGGGLQFYTQPTGAADMGERMRIDNNGNVGIGTTGPVGNLDVGPTITPASSATNYATKIDPSLSGAVNTTPQTAFYSLFNVPTINLSGTSATVTTAYSNYIGATVSAGTATTWYGNYIANPTGAGSIGTKYALVTEASSGNVGFGTTTPSALVEVYSGSSRLTINSSGQLALPTTGTSAGLVIGATNTVTIQDSATVAERAGTARRSYTVSLRPEYDGAVMTPPAASESLTSAGNMTSDFCANTVGSFTNVNNTAATGCPTAGDVHNFYQWVSTGASSTDYYDIYVRWQVPSDFSDWDTINHSGAYISGYGYVTNITNDDVTVSVYDTGGTIRATNVSIKGTAAAWSSAVNVLTSNTGTWTAGGFVTFKIRMKSNTTADYTRVGEINLYYLSKFK